MNSLEHLEDRIPVEDLDNLNLVAKEFVARGIVIDEVKKREEKQPGYVMFLRSSQQEKYNAEQLHTSINDIIQSLAKRGVYTSIDGNPARPTAYHIDSSGTQIVLLVS